MDKKLELWINNIERDPVHAGEFATKLEADGWDGTVFFDSQCMFGELWSTMSYCAAITSTLKLASGVTNPVTRHPSVTAGAAATLQRLSGGRVALGVGRGDSALAHVGAAPMAVGPFTSYLEMLQAYLRGQGVALSDAAQYLVGTDSSFKNLALDRLPPSSQINWLDASTAQKVPVEVMASGPKVIAAGAVAAERVIFALGAEVDRLRGGLASPSRRPTVTGATGISRTRLVRADIPAPRRDHRARDGERGRGVECPILWNEQESERTNRHATSANHWRSSPPYMT